MEGPGTPEPPTPRGGGSRLLWLVLIPQTTFPLQDLLFESHQPSLCLGAWNQTGSQVASLHPEEGLVPAQPNLPKFFSLIRNQMD